jgi:hypothetical protein
MEENEVTLRNLPRTVLIEVFKLLDSKTRGRCTAVCRDWLAIVSLPECWRRLDLPLQPGDNLHTVFTQGKQPWPELWERWLGNAFVYHFNKSLSGESPLLNCIDITGQSADKGYITYILQFLPGLKDLRIGMLFDDTRYSGFTRSPQGPYKFAGTVDLRLLYQEVPGPDIDDVEELLNSTQELQRLHLGVVFCHSDDPRMATLLRRERPFHVVTVGHVVVLFERRRHQHVDAAALDKQLVELTKLLPVCGCDSLRLWRAPLTESSSLEMVVNAVRETASISELLLDGCKLDEEHSAHVLEQLLRTCPRLRVSVNVGQDDDDEQRAYLTLADDGHLSAELLDDYEAGVDYESEDYDPELEAQMGYGSD